jgi:hypothetical protein
LKRKGERNIPDFSRKPKPAPGVKTDAKAMPVQDRPLKPQPKPQATSAKSGRRGP